MGTYGLHEVIRRWGREQLTPEQAIGQILLLLVELDKRLQKLEGRAIHDRSDHRERQTHSESLPLPHEP
jgi:hypothetical protein